jgi:catechol 2,3-dioxygenase-like lactoylglutathione lyase family enzyme
MGDHVTVRFTGLNHVCIATRDLDRAVATWRERYGVGPWRIWTKDASNMTSSPQFAMRVALADLSSTTRIELIEPLDELSPYAASLVRCGDADHVHHIRLDVDDYDDARRELEVLGLDVVLDADFAGAEGVEVRVRATYFSTERDLGFLLELADVPDGFVMPPAEGAP